MPLIKCPDCGKEISDKAPACPNCGRPAGKPTEVEIEHLKKVKEKRNAVIFSLFIILLILVIFGLVHREKAQREERLNQHRESINEFRREYGWTD